MMKLDMLPLLFSKYKIVDIKYKGFTLIEILVVVAILGILSTLALANFRTSQIKSRDARRKSDLKQIQNAMELIYNDHGRYPGSAGGQIVACDYNPPNPVLSRPCTWGDTVNDMSDGRTIYLKAIPEDPSGYTYFYQSDSAGTKYRVLARLENTQDQSLIPDYTGIAGTNCGTGQLCNFGLASANLLPQTAP